MSIVFMKVSVTSTVICVDNVLSSSLRRLSDADSNIGVERPENDTSQGLSEVR